MNISPITCRPIGIIHTPFPEPKGMPIQPAGAEGIKGTIEMYPEFVPGLKDLDGFSHIILLFHLHKSEGYKLSVVPFLDDEERGLFSTRAPRRPNPIGLSVVRLIRIEGAVLHIENVDIVDGTPLLDIKPYAPEFTLGDDVRIGWLEKYRGEVGKRSSDGRFDGS